MGYTLHAKWDCLVQSKEHATLLMHELLYRHRSILYTIDIDLLYTIDIDLYCTL